MSTKVESVTHDAASAVRPRGSTATARPGDGEFNTLLDRARVKVKALSEKLVASTFLVPMLDQMQKDPFRSQRFHGGFGEDVFQGQLNNYLADGIATGKGFKLTDVITSRFMTAIENSPARLERAANMRIETVG